MTEDDPKMRMIREQREQHRRDGRLLTQRPREWFWAFVGSAAFWWFVGWTFERFG